MNQRKSSKSTGILWMIIAYLISIGGAAASIMLVSHLSLLWQVAIADIVGTLIIFGFSLCFKNSSFYDPYWSVAPIVIAAYYLFLGEVDLRSILVFSLVSFWGIRLTYNFLIGWPGLHHQDWRYDDLQTQHGKAYWLVSISGIHLFPTILVFGGCLALYPAIIEPTISFGWLDIVAALITFSAVLIELVSDEQLRSFTRSNTTPGATFTAGLWAYSRHPNYFGETLFWWGLYLFAMAANPAFWWCIIGPLAITALFLFISIPMIDKRMMKRRKNYREHTKGISAFVPWFPKK